MGLAQLVVGAGFGFILGWGFIGLVTGDYGGGATMAGIGGAFVLGLIGVFS